MESTTLNQETKLYQIFVGNMVVKIADFITHHRYSLLFFCMLLVILAGLGMRELKISANYEAYFDSDNVYLKALEKIEETYTQSDNVGFILTPKNQTIFSKEILTAIDELTELAWQLDYAKRVDSITNFQHSYAIGDEIIIDDLFNQSMSLTSEGLIKLKEVALNEPALVPRLINSAASVTAVNVIFQLPGIDDGEETPLIVSNARELQQIFEKKYPNIDVRLVGVLVSNNAFTAVVKNDLITLIPLSLLVIIIGIGFFTRSIIGVVGAIFVITLSIITAMGIAGWFGVKVTSPVMVSPSMIMTLSVADCLHLLFGFFYHFRLGETKFNAIKSSIQLNFKPIVLTSLTTAIGFLSLNFSDSPPFRDLGNVVAVGVLAAMFFSLILLPVIILILPIKKTSAIDLHPIISQKISQFVIQYDKYLFISILVVSAILCTFISRNELNDVFQEYFSQRLDVRKDIEYSNQHLVGINQITYSIPSGKPEGVSDPDYLHDLSKLVIWFQSQPKVVHVSSYIDVIKKLNKNMHEDDQSYYRIPDNKALAMQYLFLYSSSLPLGLELNNMISFDESATRVVVELGKISSQETLEFEGKVTQWMQKNLPKEMQATGSSAHVLFAHIGQMNIKNMLEGVMIALLLISAILIFALKSFKYGMISLIPNILPVAMAFGIWGLIIGQIGLSLSVVAGITIGIVVDYSVHFLTKYLKAKREDQLSTIDAVNYAFNTVGYAILITTIVLVIGFMVLALSPFKPNFDMGIMTAITICFALIVDFLFLPAILLLWDKHKTNGHTKASEKLN